MVNQLLNVLRDAQTLQNRLVLIAGATAAQRSELLVLAASASGGRVVRLGIDFSRRLSVVPRRQRALLASTLLRETVESRATPAQPAFLDRSEVLFDRGLQLDPLESLKRLARARTVVASWPGQLRDGRLIYAPANHPEHRDYSATGAVLFHLT